MPTLGGPARIDWVASQQAASPCAYEVESDGHKL